MSMQDILFPFRILVGEDAVNISCNGSISVDDTIRITLVSPY